VVRELLVAFTGNEITIATTLAFWLLSVAAGCLMFKTRAGSSDRPVTAGVLFIIAGLLALLQVVLIRLLHPLTVTFGEIPHPALVMALTAIGVAPCAIILGGLFVNLVSLAEKAKQRAPVSATYGAETLGSGVTGLLLGVYLLESMSPIAIAGLASMVGLVCGLYLIALVGGVWAARCRALAVLGLAGLTFLLAMSPRVDLVTRQVQWDPLKVTKTVDSRYGSIVVTDRGGLHDFFESGVLAFTVPDHLYAEECAHIPLLHHPNPETILLIGGTGSGVIGEVAKHPSVKVVDYIELDPAVIELVEAYSPPGWMEGAGTDVTAIYGDGRQYVAGTERAYDVVIINVGTPVSLQINRYYTVEFFEHVRARLKGDGIMSLKIPMEGAYISPELASILAAMVNGCREVFGNVTLVPGAYIHVLASPDAGIEARTAQIIETLAARGVGTSYITEPLLLDRLSPLRSADLDSLIMKYDSGITNTDARPVSFTYAISLWAKHFKSGKAVSILISWMSLGNCLVLLIVVGLVAVTAHMRAVRASWSALPSVVAIYSMGFTAMFTEVLILLSYQVVSGYIYTRLAAVVAAFMLGMGFAASLVGARRRRPARSWVLPLLHIGLVVIPPAVVVVSGILKSRIGLIQGYFADLVFILMAFATGTLGGSIFGVASYSLAFEQRSAAEGAAIAYSLDLVGACVAGFATGLLIIPSLGLIHSAYALALTNLVALVPISLGMRVRLTTPPR
jgi:spermidine synthase